MCRYLIYIRRFIERAAPIGQTVSPFVPFELRPNLDLSAFGFNKAAYTADFVDRSESLLEVARDGRADAAISNLFTRTLELWRGQAWRCALSSESLVSSAARLEMVAIGKILPKYLDAKRIQDAKHDFNALSAELDKIRFPHKVATIHGDLHGDNVRVRGDEAVLIDLGAVKGTDKVGEGAPLSFDVAMLEVSLIFTCTDQENDTGDFDQVEWENSIRAFYALDKIKNSPPRPGPPSEDSWRYGVLQRLRGFSGYDQSDQVEYAIALVIAMWRWCKFEPLSKADLGRRVAALAISAQLVEEIVRDWKLRK